MGTRVTATLEDLHLEVLEDLKQQHGLGSDAAGVRTALEEVGGLSDQLDDAHEQISQMEQRLEQRDREFRLMSVVVPMALGMDREAAVEMLPGMDADEIPELPETYQLNRQVNRKGQKKQPGALERAKRWLVGWEE
jgi:hypothetical protein